MEQENYRKETENPAEASTKSLSLEKSNKEAEAENPKAVSTKSQSSEKNKMEAENIVEASTKAQSSRKGTPKSLKAKSKIMKNPLASNSLKAKKAKGTPQGRGRNRKKKNTSLSQGDRESGKNEKSLNSREEKNRKNANEEHARKGQAIQRNQERIGGSNKSQQNQRSEDKHGGSDGGSKNQKNKGKLDGKEKSLREEKKKKKEKLGGLIFMCSGKTKPDCFRYRVMGVTISKKDLVLAVKPGLKLFLYDFDLKLMYGIYEASSSGGMRLEPKAFGGSFPVQVRFNVYKDCFPLAESVFKKAIRDNYNEKNKFKIELTEHQVRKLGRLFRPAMLQSVQSAAAPVLSPPMAATRDREVYEEERESRLHSDREAFTRANVDGRYRVLSHERDHRLEVVSAQREKIPRDLYMSENEYRTYGLQGEKRNLTASSQIAVTLDPYRRNQEREHLFRQPDPLHIDTVPVQRESVVVDPVYLNQREFQSYNLGVRHESLSAAPSIAATASDSTATALDSYARDPYYAYHYGASSVDAYLPTLRREVSSGPYYVDTRRETYLVDADPLHRQETERVDKTYSTYAVDALSDYNQVPHYHEAKLEIAPPPVSSRYAFAGPSVSYR